mmetsp:Transcript_13477/g.22997  ORF Transcript_13477/g.22997 Transcript_13477/m.22997 type:complete len:80 (+) Transcript_13477:126-365(+)
MNGAKMSTPITVVYKSHVAVLALVPHTITLLARVELHFVVVEMMVQQKLLFALIACKISGSVDMLVLEVATERIVASEM